MTEISLNEDSFSSWHTCPEDSKYKSDNGSTKNNKTSNENILKDLNLDLDNSDDESIVEFEKFVDQSDAFNKLKEFKENTSNEDFLRPVTPSGSLRRENSPSLYPNFVRPKYLSDQQNVSLADKLTPANNIHKNVVEITPTEIPTTKINNEKVSNTLTVPNVNNLLSPLNQSSALTLVDTDNQEYDITMPGGSLAIFDNSKVDLKNDINNIKENIKDKKNDIKEDIKDKKNDIKETIKDTKEKIIENVNNTNDKLHSNSEDDENQGENQGTLGRFFSYFRGFGKADNNESANNENLTNEKKNKPVTENKNQKTLIETVEALGSPSNVYTNIPGLLPTESVVTVVNDSEEDYDDDDEFANALDSAPENVINTKQHDFANTKVSTTVTLNNPTDISINGNEAVVEEIVVIQNPDGTETTAKKVIYTVDENGNQNPIKTIVYNDDVDLDAYNNQAYHDPNANVYNKQIITPNINNNNVTTTTQDDAVIEEEQSITSSEDCKFMIYYLFLLKYFNNINFC